MDRRAAAVVGGGVGLVFVWFYRITDGTFYGLLATDTLLALLTVVTVVGAYYLGMT